MADARHLAARWGGRDIAWSCAHARTQRPPWVPVHGGGSAVARRPLHTLSLSLSTASPAVEQGCAHACERCFYPGESPKCLTSADMASVPLTLRTHPPYDRARAGSHTRQSVRSACTIALTEGRHAGWAVYRALGHSDAKLEALVERRHSTAPLRLRRRPAESSSGWRDGEMGGATHHRAVPALGPSPPASVRRWVSSGEG